MAEPVDSQCKTVIVCLYDVCVYVYIGLLLCEFTVVFLLHAIYRRYIEPKQCSMLWSGVLYGAQAIIRVVMTQYR